MEKKALELFHCPPQNYNCAQAVAAAHQAITGDSSLNVESFRAFGGGRAPGGECGALFAACQINPGNAEAIRAAFQKQAGHLDCASIRVKGAATCRACVALAAGLLESDSLDF
ncbi:hypothetical protein [Holophaga foetida]|uniref:hypothetical protein n=1 Tax=Holophaga foetida TaxID=35839 RepID=UPI0002474300|nr:hypothetical protein [Holophaga foetida]